MRAKYLILFVLSIIAVSSFSGCNGSNAITPNPNSGITATEVFRDYDSAAWHRIAGFDQTRPLDQRKPGFLMMLNVSLLAARHGAREIESFVPIDTLLFVFNNGWFGRSTDTLSGGSLAFRWKLTPNPFRNEGTPTRYDQRAELSYTDNLHISTTRLTSVMYTIHSGNYYQGQYDQRYEVEISILGIPQTISYGAPLNWDQLDCRRNSSNQFLSPQGIFSAVGTSDLTDPDSSGASKTYNFQGNWNIARTVSVHDSIGSLSVGGELFASYFYTGFDSTSGVYRGSYRLANGRSTLYSFSMQ